MEISLYKNNLRPLFLMTFSNKGKRKIFQSFYENYWALCVYMCAATSTLWTCVDCRLSGSSVHGILQARILERMVMPSFRGSSIPREQTHLSMSPALASRLFATSSTWEAHWATYTNKISTKLTNIKHDI